MDALRFDVSVSSIELDANGQPDRDLLVDRVLIPGCGNVSGDKENWEYFFLSPNLPVRGIFSTASLGTSA